MSKPKEWFEVAVRPDDRVEITQEDIGGPFTVVISVDQIETLINWLRAAQREVGNRGELQRSL